MAGNKDQMTMFQSGEDLPLFSGTAQRAQLEPAGAQRPRLIRLGEYTCGLCLDTGVLKVAPGRHRYCTCDAGQNARKRLQNHE